MKQLYNITFLILFFLLITITACKKDKTSDTDGDVIVPTGAITLKFENVAGTAPLELDSKWYVNQNADSFRVSLFRYYISNIQLIKADGSIFSEPESYHLVDQGRLVSQIFTINNIPVGEYKSIRFLIGVDSIRNVSGIQSGALSPANDMFWTWKSGYIMAKLEGQRTKLNGADRYLTFHIGGYSGANNAIKKVELPFSSLANVNASVAPVVTFKADVLEWFRSPNVIQFDKFSFAMAADTNSKKIADNYADMFTVKSIRN